LLDVQGALVVKLGFGAGISFAGFLNGPDAGNVFGYLQMSGHGGLATGGGFGVSAYFSHIPIDKFGYQTLEGLEMGFQGSLGPFGASKFYGLNFPNPYYSGFSLGDQKEYQDHQKLIILFMSVYLEHSKNSKNIGMLTILFLLALWSCSEMPCLDSDVALKSVTVENNGHSWNCGLEVWVADDDDLSIICNFLSSLKEIKPASVRLSHWRLDVYMNDESKKGLIDNLELFHSAYNGFVFRKCGKYYSNDDFANYLIQSLGITKSDSSRW